MTKFTQCASIVFPAAPRSFHTAIAAMQTCSYSCLWSRFFGAGIVILSMFSLCACGKPDNRSLDSVASSIRARASLVQAMKDARKISENGRGYLRSEQGVYLDIQDRRILEEENYEREKVFALIAKDYQVGKRNVETIFARKASKLR